MRPKEIIGPGILFYFIVFSERFPSLFSSFSPSSIYYSKYTVSTSIRFVINWVYLKIKVYTFELKETVNHVFSEALFSSLLTPR